MTDALQFTLNGVVQELRSKVIARPRAPSDLQRNAVLWLATRAGTASRESSFCLDRLDSLATERLSEAAYLAAVGFAAAALGLPPSDVALCGPALERLIKRSAHTFEGGGYADDPLCAAGLIVLADLLGLPQAARVVCDSLAQSGLHLSPGVAAIVQLALGDRLVVQARFTEESAGVLAATVLGHRANTSLAAQLFPSRSASQAEQLLIDGVCRARFSLGQDLDAMIALAVLESGSSTPHQPTAPLSQGAPLLKPLTILFMAANPDTSNSLALDEEARSIETKLRASNYRDAVRFRTRWAVRPDDFLQAFNEDRPAIVHFSGHGAGASGLVLHDGASGVRLVPAAALRRLFSTMKDEIRVVVLNACYSAEQADKIAEVIDCVVGMTDTVGDEAAKMFAASFYRAIAFGRDVKNAFEQGLAAVELEGLDEQDIPTLIVRSGVDPSKVVLIS